jgi:hypothetical protein
MCHVECVQQDSNSTQTIQNAHLHLHIGGPISGERLSSPSFKIQDVVSRSLSKLDGRTGICFCLSLDSTQVF